MGMLKKAASGVLAILPCSRTESTLRASKWLRPCWADFFEHSLPLMMLVSLQGCMGHRREIFNGSPIHSPQHFLKSFRGLSFLTSRLTRPRFLFESQFSSIHKVPLWPSDKDWRKGFLTFTILDSLETFPSLIVLPHSDGPHSVETIGWFVPQLVLYWWGREHGFGFNPFFLSPWS